MVFVWFSFLRITPITVLLTGLGISRTTVGQDKVVGFLLGERGIVPAFVTGIFCQNTTKIVLSQIDEGPFDISSWGNLILMQKFPLVFH